MNKPMAWLSAAVIIAVMFGGCCPKQRAETTDRICAQGVDKQAVMDAAQSVLENMHFTIEKADANAGYISTRPLPAGQFFELWRSDTVGCENFAEDNLHSVTRTAEINIAPQNGDVCVVCKIEKRRLSMPAAEVSGKKFQPLKLDKAQQKDAVWIDMGNDPQLETKILERIDKQIKDNL